MADHDYVMSLPTVASVMNGHADPEEEVYQIDIRILRFAKARTFTQTDVWEETLVFIEDLESPFDAVYVTENAAVAHAVARNLEGHAMRMLPIDEDAVVEREVNESLL